MKRAVLGVTAGLCLSLVSLLVVWSRFDGDVPRSVEVWPLVLALLAAPTSWLVQGTMIWVLVRPQALKVGLWQMTRLYLAAGFIGAVTPFGGAEIPYHLYVLKKLGLPTGVGTAIVATKAVLNVTVLVLGAGVALVFTSVIPEAEGRAALLAALVLCGAWAAVAYFVRRSPGVGEAPQGSGLRERLRGFRRDLGEGFTTLWRREPGAVLACGALQFLYWPLVISIGPLALTAVGWSGDWGSVLAALLVLHALLPFAPTPGASGAAELGFAALVARHVAGGALLEGVLIWRGLTYFLPLIAGAFFLGRQAGGRLSI